MYAVLFLADAKEKEQHGILDRERNYRIEQLPRESVNLHGTDVAITELGDRPIWIVTADRIARDLDQGLFDIEAGPDAEAPARYFRTVIIGLNQADDLGKPGSMLAGYAAHTKLPDGSLLEDDPRFQSLLEEQAKLGQRRSAGLTQYVSKGPIIS